MQIKHFICICYSGLYILEIILKLAFIVIFKLFFFFYFFTTTGPPTKVSAVLREHGQTLNRNKNEVN